MKVAQSCLTLCHPMDYTVHGILQARILEWGSLSLLQGIFPTQGLNPGLLHCRQILYQMNHRGNPGYQSSLHRINTHPCQWYCAWAIVRVPDADLEEAVTGSDHVRGNPGGHVLTWPFPTELKEGLRGQRHEISSLYNYGNRKRVKTVSYPRTYSSFHTVI